MKNKWPMFAIVYIAALTVSFSQLKIPPVMVNLESYLNRPIPEIAQLMAIFTLAGIVLAIPGAAIMVKLGAKRLLLVLMGCLAVGNFIGAAVMPDFKLLMISRIIEGIAFALIIMVSIYMISVWFSDGGAGFAIGIFNTFAPAGSGLTMLICLSLAKSAGISSLWTVSGILGVLCFILVLFFIKIPEIKQKEGQRDKVSIVSAAANPKMWVIAIALACVAFMMFVFLTTYPEWFMGYYGVTPEKANFYTLFMGLAGIPTCIIVGKIIDKTGKPLLVLLAGFIGMFIMSAAILSLNGSPAMFMTHAAVSSIAGGFSMTACFVVAPSLAKDHRYIGYTMAFVNLIYFIGVYLSTPTIMKAIVTQGFGHARTIMMAVSALGIAMSLLIMFMTKNRSRQNT